MKTNFILIFTLLMLYLVAYPVFAQLENLHGDEQYSLNGLHSGNMLRTTFYNDGMVGNRGSTSPEDIGGEWPINSGRFYLAKMSTLFGAEVKDTDGELKHIISESNGTSTGGLNDSPSSGDAGPTGEWWTMAPLPGFANENPGDESYDGGPHIAMSHWNWSWPPIWPDKMDDANDPGWPQSWNGYFGKNIQNADQESYYVIDDYNNREFSFYPDEYDENRRGLGLRVTVRGFQWSNVLVEDNLFLLYDVQNIATHSHDKINFGFMVAPNMGSTESMADSDDDGGMYVLEEELGYQYDADDLGAGGWTPVGRLGVAFFESPGNPFDGIDNDGDAILGAGDIISESMFNRGHVNVGDPIVLIDYKTFERTRMTMPAEGVSVTYLDREYKFYPGDELAEIANDLIDNNLNGIIDENNGSTFGEGESQIVRYLYEGLKYVNYLDGEQGGINALIDEKRDDGIDNDGDWDINVDDVGLDGVPNTNDFGEGDGIPTSGVGTNLPGEPHIDKTDIEESDMIGLTAFNIFLPWTIYPLSDDEGLWDAIYPGFLNATGQVGNTDVLLGSGFFPLIPGQIERYSVGYIMGYHDELFRNKVYAEQTYVENYNFAKAPNIPNVDVVPGDKKVILYWDDFAEQSRDPITGMDFEGYKIYRSTDPGFNDMATITNAYASAAYKLPLAQFDLDNDYQGLASVPVNGVQFNLGDNTGITHTFVDTTVVNGQLYYYAVTSYDRGCDSLGIAPSECSKYISVTKDGKVDKGNNVVLARPEAPSAGFTRGGFKGESVDKLPGSTTDAFISYEIIQPADIKDDHSYRITFQDTVTGTRDTPLTKNYTLTDITSGDTLVAHDANFNEGHKTPLLDGFLLTFHGNPEELAWNEASSAWNRREIYVPIIGEFRSSDKPNKYIPADFKVIIGQVGIDTSVAFVDGRTDFPAMPVNFTILNTTLNEKVKFAFRERDALEGEDGKFTARSKGFSSDEIVFLKGDSLNPGWQLSMTKGEYAEPVQPEAGDTLTLVFNKPFLSHDVFEFTTIADKVDANLAKDQMDNIKVVPNPYIVTNSWEPINPYANGRGPRELHFTHLPEKCTIKIFNIRGQLVKELEHDTPNVANGTEIWDMQTKDFLEISYGVYVYHVEAEGIGEKIGKFAVIK